MEIFQCQIFLWGVVNISKQKSRNTTAMASLGRGDRACRTPAVESSPAWSLIWDLPHIWRFPEIGVPQNGWLIMENPIKIRMIWG